LRIILTITNGGATTTDAAGIDVNTFAAGAGTTTASGIRIDGPTGATNNYSLNILSGMTLVGAGALVGQMPTVFSPSTVRVMSVSTGSTDKLAGFFSQQTSIAQTSGPQGFEGYAYTSHTSGTVSLMIGMIGNSEHSGTSTTTAMRGGQFQVLTTSSGGGTDAAACFASCTGQVAGGSGTFTNGYCFFAAGFGSGYTNKYAFYSADANSLMLVPGVYNNTSGSAANMFIDSTGLMFRSTSSLAFKTDLEPIAIEDARRVIRALSPGGVAAGFTYRSVGAVDRRRFLGWGAEQVAPVDPLLASFTRAGEPESVMYDRATVYLAALVTDQDDTIRRLTDQVAALETRLNRAA
jgi:hypothetical protein